MNNPANVEVNDEHALGRSADLSCLLRSWRCWALPLQRLLVGLQIVPIDPSLIPSDDLRHEGWVIQDTLMEILIDFGTEFLLIRGQKPWVRTLQQCGAYSTQTLGLNPTLGLSALFHMKHQRWQQCH